MAGYYARISDRELIGGPYPYTHFSGFCDGLLFNRQIEDISHKQMFEYFALYNIGWVIAYTEESNNYFSQVKSLTLIDEFDGLRLYKANQNLNYFIEGDGEILSRNFNEVVVRLDGVENHVLKFHFVNGLKVSPKGSISPVYMLDDPIPFVKINDVQGIVTLGL